MDDNFTRTKDAATSAWDGQRVLLEQVGSAIAICTTMGALTGATPTARRLLASIGVSSSPLPQVLPQSLWSEITSAPIGEATEWRPQESGAHGFLGVTRYRLGSDHLLLLMREVSQKHRDLSRRLHQQRLEAVGRLVAMIAHDLRAPLSSIVFNVDVLATRPDRLTHESLQTVVSEMRASAERLRWTVDGLLDFARLGPPVSANVRVAEVFERVSGLLRPAFRDGSHRLVSRVGDGASSVRGNTLVIEQILVNLAMNATEAATSPITVELVAESLHPEALPPREGRTEAGLIGLSVVDDGPGVPPELRTRIFEPFFTTKARGTGIGLTTAREAAQGLGGDLLLDARESGTRFTLLLPAGSAQTERPPGRL